MPDAHHPSARPSAAAIGSTTSNSAVSASRLPVSPGAAGTPAPHPVPDLDLVLEPAYARIAADGSDVFSGRLARGDRAEPGVRVRLLEHVDGVPGWRYAGRR